jgi:hypothetical protein
MFGLAADFSGKLLDAPCYDTQKKSASCNATSATTAFAIDVSGTIYKLDRDGNSKAAAALKNRADRADPNQPQSKEILATVQGTDRGGMIVVEHLDVQ